MFMLSVFSWREPCIYRESWLLEWVKKLKNRRGIRGPKWLSGRATVELLLDQIKEKIQRDRKSQRTKQKDFFPKKLANGSNPTAASHVA